MSDDFIKPEQAKTLYGLFQERVKRTPEHSAYRFFDALNGVWSDATWHDMHRDVSHWQVALAAEKLEPGDRVAIMARNSRFWVMFDLAAISLGLVVVPLYTEDRADNVRYVLEDANVKLLVIGGEEQWEVLSGHLDDMEYLQRIVSIAQLQDAKDQRLTCLSSWLPFETDETVELPQLDTDELATIVYTSGTTGKPKGVMLSHKNLLSNAYQGLLAVPTINSSEIFLSFLPLSHTLERTVGYYLPMMAGAIVAHARSIPDLAKDLLTIRPTALISVPRIYERVYSRIKEGLANKPKYNQVLFKLAVKVGWQRFQYEQGRAFPSPLLLLWPLLKRLVADKLVQRLGGRIRVAISGGAALSPDVSKVFIGLGVPILQGYGLTESSPVISVNRIDNNIPASIGPPLPGVQVKIGADDELLAKGDNVMMGFWNNEEETHRVLKGDWLHTGDKARIEGEHIYITGRIKDIIVMANGEKVSPVDMELAIAEDILFDQAVIVGEALPFLSAIVVLNRVQWQKIVKQQNLSEDEQIEQVLINRISKCLHDFPGYAQVHKVTYTDEPWSVDNGLLTPTLKVKRPKVMEKYAEQIDGMYEGKKVIG